MRIIKQIINFNTIPQFKVLKVAAYCSISTSNENQLYSLDNQVSYYENEIKKNINWEFAGVYADKVSGRNRSKRKEF
ncbi:hypothetical protein KPL50_19990 [Clostridium sp. CF012]|nr:hypothetical protein [Clostridium sp. CF012]